MYYRSTRFPGTRTHDCLTLSRFKGYALSPYLGCLVLFLGMLSIRLLSAINTFSKYVQETFGRLSPSGGL